MRSIDNKAAGFSLMEMLISIVIGMIIVAAASTMLVNILKAQKDITSSARLNQELGAVMAVMSNEIRRAGFSVCKEKTPVTFTCPDPPLSYGLGEDIKIGDGGKCIEYRYNADLNHQLDTLGEHRAFRFNINKIQMSDINKNASCASADLTDSTKWVDLTDPDVINITTLNFSTTGSKCRNMSGNFYWVVGDGATELACSDGANLDSAADCIDLNDPVDLLVAAAGCGTATIVSSDWVTDKWVVPPQKDTLFGVNQIRITMQAELTRDQAVLKNLQISVKVANPWIQLAE